MSEIVHKIDMLFWRVISLNHLIATASNNSNFKMSATTNTLSNTVVEVKTKAPRVNKPTLVGKYSKFLVFGYGLVQSLQAQGLLTDEGVESAYGELKLLSSVEDQTQFYEGVLNQSKETGKLMRKYVTQRLAPPKAPRAKKDSVARKPRAKKEAGPEEAGEVKEKKKKSVSRTKKATRVESDVSSDIVAELVDAANAEPVVNNDATEKKALKEAEKKAKQEAKEAEKKAKEQAKEAEKQAKQEAKEAEKKAKQEAKEAEKKAKQEAADAKKSAVAGKKVKTAAPPAPVVVVAEELQEEEGEDEEIHTQETDINGKTYLIDNENNLYSCVTHEELGKYDPETKSIVASA